MIDEIDEHFWKLHWEELHDELHKEYIQELKEQKNDPTKKFDLAFTHYKGLYDYLDTIPYINF